MIPLPEPQTHWPIGNSKESALFNVRQMQAYAAAHAAADMAKEIESLRARVAELEKDAERYRWMKQEVKRIPLGWELIGWDAAIDAAMRGEG